MATDAQSSFYVDGEGLQSSLPTGEANQEAQSSFYSNEGGGTATYASIQDLVARAETAATEAEAAAASIEDVSADAAAAAASAAAALVSETNAAASEASAATSASNAATSETNASASASAASTSEANASTSEANAAASASSASTSASNAATSETNAATSASNAATSESNAATSETNAASSASSASTSASNAATSETNAATSEANASTSETNAAASEAAAEAAWDNFDDRYLGAKASDPALDNDGNALLTGALYFNTTTNDMKMYTGSVWKDLAADAETAQTAAEAAKTAAETAQTNAETAETNAETSETNAASSASSASTSASNAATSASNAATSETNAAASYDAFDDRYLGSKSSDPTLDNDSNALLTGALYWNTSTNLMRVYNGSTWADVTTGQASNVSTGAGAPGTTPSAEGDIYVDTTNDEYYIAVGTASSADWSQGGGGGGSGTVDTFGTPVANDFARFTDADTIEGRSYAEVRSDLGLEIGTDVQAYSAVLAATTASFLVADETKLDGIADGAEVNNISITGTPANNQIAFWSGADGLKTQTGFEYSSSRLKVAGETYIHANGIYRSSNNDFMTYSGGSANTTGANMVLFGGAHGTYPNGIRFRTDSIETLRWDNTNSKWTSAYPWETGALDVTGNITVSGTVDGRDIATDGTKLDGIEASADVTDATNVAAAGAVMESDTSTALMGFVIDEDLMTSNSATKVPTQQSVKAYVDANAGGGGDVTKVGTPVDSQVGVWTGDGTIEGDTALTFNTTTDVLTVGGLAMGGSTSLAAIDGSGVVATGQVNVTGPDGTAGPYMAFYGPSHPSYPDYTVFWNGAAPTMLLLGSLTYFYGTTVTYFGSTLNATSMTTVNFGTSSALTAGSINLGHASDTTLARAGSGYLSVEGKNIPRITSDVTTPSSAPAYVGEIYIDTILDNIYISKGTASSADWEQVDNSGGGAGISGTPVDGRIAVWTGATDIEGDASFTFDTTTDKLTVGVGSGTASIDINPGVGQSGILTLHGAGIGYTIEGDGSSKAGSANDFRITNGTNGDIWEFDNSNLWQSFKGRVRHGASTAATGTNAPKIDTGTTVPATTPDVEGDIFVDTTNDNIYMAKGQASSADWVQVNGGGSGPSVSTGSGAPASTPGAEGDIYIDTTNDYFYIAVGTASSADWDLVNVAGDNTVWIPAAAFSMYESADVPELTGEATTSNPRGWQYLGFDATTEEEAEFTLVYPDGWDNGTVTAEIYWYENSAGGTGGVVFGLIGTSYTDGDLSDGADGTQVTVTDNASNTNNTIHITPATSAITIGGSPAAGHLCHFAVSREVANGSDTYVLDASIIGIKLIYTENKPNDN